jgi:hypothetical protein
MIRLCFVLFFWFFLYNQLLLAQGRVFIESSSISKAEREAILILPGFGSKVFGTKNIAKFFKYKGYDVFIPKYISRKSVGQSVENVDRFVLKHGLKEYKKLHVFSYIFGTWAINLWIKEHGKCNISTMVFDRSPLQERAPEALIKDSPILAKVLFGDVMADFCNTAYLPINDTSILKGIFIETYATRLIYKHKKTALKNGPVTFDVQALNQSYTDFCYIPLNHDEMYQHLDVFGNEVLNFIKDGSFSPNIKQNSFLENPFVKFEKK